MAKALLWPAIVPHFGSVENAFEQLCAILAHRDEQYTAIPNAVYVRNGRPDGGAECLWKLPDGSAHCYQAKYFLSSLKAAQWRQLDDSMSHALSKYPTLASMTVCLPLDLPHSPIRGASTLRQRWEQWVAKWKRHCKRKGRCVEIFLWGSHELSTALVAPANSGLRAFFFDESVLTPADIGPRIIEQTRRAGARYFPEVHVDPGLDSLFTWLTAPEHFRLTLRVGVERVMQVLDNSRLRDAYSDNSEFMQRQGVLRTAMHALSDSLSSSALPSFAAMCVQARESARALVSLCYRDEPRREYAQDGTSAVKEVGDADRWNASKTLRDTLHNNLAFADGDRDASWIEPLDRRVAIITGSGGCGKTHLVCEAARRIAEQSRPVVLMLGHQISVPTLWRDILSNWGGTSNHVEFLGALDAAGEATGCRSLLIIDAINESEGNRFWPAELRALAAALAQHPHVALVLTIRDSYRQLLLPSGGQHVALPVIEHPGFGGVLDDATTKYFNHFNITPPSVPALHREFENPLFLSVFCQAIAGEPDPQHRRPPYPFPGGTVGFARVFEKLIERRQSELFELYGLDLDGSSTPLQDALSEIADQMVSSPDLVIGRSRCRDILAKHLRSPNLTDNLVGHLESAGVLLTSARREARGRLVETVQFAYDRMGAQFVAERWLRDKKTVKEAAEVMGAKGPFEGFRELAGEYGRIASIREALCLSWPYHYGQELFDSAPHLIETPEWRTAFLDSLGARPDSTLGTGAALWLKRSLDAHDSVQPERAQLVDRMLVNVSNRPIIEALHDYLLRIPLPERDSWWTTAMSYRHSHSLDRLLRWSRPKHGIAIPERVLLDCATSLAWYTSTTKPLLRATVTKAITALLDRDVVVAVELLRRFSVCNDYYVLQCVSAAVYGACIRARDADAVRSVAECVRTQWPNKSEWPVDLFIRHALCGIVEVAQDRNPHWRADLEAVRPPYKSSWIKRIPTWAGIKRLGRGRLLRGSRGFETVVRSCAPDGKYPGLQHMYGDFGRYVVSANCYNFLPDAWAMDDSPGLKLPFAFDAPHRFIIHRVLEMGWTPRRFEDFDRTPQGRYSRYVNEVERVGKKYQWLALSEFLARASDRFPVREPYNDERWVPYQLPRQLTHDFQLDTTVLESKRDGRERLRQEQSSHWWSSCDGDSWWVRSSNDAWLRSPKGFPDPQRYCVQREPSSGKLTAMLWGYLSWAERDPNEPLEEQAVKRRLWMHIRGGAVRSQDFEKLKTWATTPELDWHFTASMEMGAMFGELFWSRAATWNYGIAERDPWSNKDGGRFGAAVPVVPMASLYVNESDPTFGTSLQALIPSKWLAGKLGVRAGRSNMEFLDRDEERVCWNPSVPEGGADVALADLRRVQAVLRAGDLHMVWSVIGEKNVLDESHSSDGPRWPRFQGLYWLDGDVPTGIFRVVVDKSPRARKSASASRTEGRRS